MSDKQKHEKDSFMGKERKAWNRGNQTQIPFTLNEGLVATDKSIGCICRETLSLMFDEILNAALSEKISTNGVTPENPELSLPNSLYSHQTQNNTINLGLATRLHFLEGGELTYWVDKAKNV